MSANNIVVAAYSAHAEAEQAVKGLQRSGFDMNKLSIVAKNPHVEEHVAGFFAPPGIGAVLGAELAPSVRGYTWLMERSKPR
jgi:hypothetical protein